MTSICNLFSCSFWTTSKKTIHSTPLSSTDEKTTRYVKTLFKILTPLVGIVLGYTAYVLYQEGKITQAIIASTGLAIIAIAYLSGLCGLCAGKSTVKDKENQEDLKEKKIEEIKNESIESNDVESSEKKSEDIKELKINSSDQKSVENAAPKRPTTKMSMEEYSQCQDERYVFIKKRTVSTTYTKDSKQHIKIAREIWQAPEMVQLMSEFMEDSLQQKNLFFKDFSEPLGKLRENFRTGDEKTFKGCYLGMIEGMGELYLRAKKT